ncbi:MAG TPA: radical SAM family heme chaperone HemW [Thermoflexia bacterium]|jgi:oxygen-independent coproporphyrinogen-3 oxidase|nr:radical SAM family heme chaperone HemW [Thermoflexia bacterium]
MTPSSIRDPQSAIYVHIPFCLRRCTYCAFNTYAGLAHLIPGYVDALRAEMGQAPRVRAHTLYFGGGTPSLLHPEQVGLLVEAVRHHFSLPDDAEISLEANPGTVDLDSLRGLRAAGVSRLSLGVQSAHDDELRLLGRLHTWDQAIEAFHTARRAGFTNINLDFIYGLPGQTLDRWRRTLEAALDLLPEHLSLYALSVEEGTPLERAIATGRLPAPDPDLAAEMYELAEGMLEKAGYAHYEISNWARRPVGAPPPSGRRRSEEVSPSACRHNLTYWRNEPYLGFGAGAASWWAGRRWTNTSHPAEYIARVNRGESPIDEIETIPPRLEMGETMMMGLRLMEGVSDDRFRQRFGVGLADVYGSELTEMQRLGLLIWDGATARLTRRGRLLGNQVFQRFLPDE